MDTKLDALIERIKKDGVEDAKRQAQQIIADAQAQAEAARVQAAQQAAEIVAQAKRQAEQLEANAKESIKQASRDTLLSVRGALKEIMAKALSGSLTTALTPQVCAELISRIVQAWIQNPNAGIEILVSSQDAERLGVLLAGSLQQEARKGIDIKISAGITQGFRIGYKGTDTHYDFTDEAITQALQSLVNPAIARLFDGKTTT